MAPDTRVASVYGLLFAALTGAASGATDLASVGRSIYTTGTLVNGSSIHATAQQDVTLPAAAAACANCHRRSGLGGSEGTARVLPITAAALFSPRTAAPIRPAYTDATLIRAITSGIGADGRRLDALMPRFALDRHSAQALTAYVHQLGATTTPGVDDHTLHLATVIADDAPAQTRDAVERVLARYFASKNGGSRHEVERAAASRRHAYGERADRAFRTWTLAVWRLHGPADTWGPQLRQFEQQQAPFALISGATGAHWQVVHEFCEQRAIPCILPIAEPPDNADQDFYSLYFTPGARLEARVTANHLARALPDLQARVTVLRRGDALSDSAWLSFSARWRELGYREPQQKIVSPEERAAPTRLELQDQPDAVVLWLDSPSMVSAVTALGGLERLPALIYTAESFTDLTQLPADFSARAHLRHVYPYSLPNAKGTAFAREQVWLRGQGLGDLDVRIAGQVLFACHVVGEQLAGIGNNFSREYFMEGLEHMLDGTNMTTLFPRTALGPQQRYLSRGAYIVESAIGGAAANVTWVDM